MNIKENRDLYLSELRSGEYNSGCTKPGLPTTQTPEDGSGTCAYAILIQLFGSDPEAAIGITPEQSMYIQVDINGQTDDLSEIADRIENEVFV